MEVMQSHIEFLLTNNLLYTSKLIYNYLNEYNKKCFTYRGLRAYWSYKRLYRESEWHTIERKIRKMAELGLLERKVFKNGNGSRLVAFCPTKLFYECLEAVMRYEYK